MTETDEESPLLKFLIFVTVEGGPHFHALLDELERRPAEKGHLTGWLGRIIQRACALGLPEELTFLISEEAVRKSGFQYDVSRLSKSISERYRLYKASQP